MSKYTPSAAGKGGQDRGGANKRQDCPIWKVVKLNNGGGLTPEEAAQALQEALEIISALKPNKEAMEWVAKYFSHNTLYFDQEQTK